MKISVIVPFYHGNAYISDLLNSLEKNYFNIKKSNLENADMEVIIVNDSPEIEIEADLSKIKVPVNIIINEKNSGIHKSRINGLKACTGEYVTFLDQDDYITDDCFVSQLSGIKDADLIICNGYILENDSKHAIYSSKEYQDMIKSISIFANYSNVIVSPGQVLLKKDKIPDEWKNYFFKNNGADDFYLWLLLFSNKAKFEVNYNKLYTHVFTGDNASLNIEVMYKSNLELIERLDKKIDKKHIKSIKRRSCCFSKSKRSIIDKMLYFDVISKRRNYQKKINEYKLENE